MNHDLNWPFHRPVLVNEVKSWLKVEKGFWYIDATVGGGGHTEEILQQGGCVFGIDQDEDALEYTGTRLATYIKTDQLKLTKGNFAHIGQLATKEGQKFAGIIFDLGISTYQIKSAGRGFSFLTDEPLDMRMSSDTEMTAAAVVNTYSQEALNEIFRKFGEEHLAWEIAAAICRARAVTKITTTGQLTALAAAVYRNSRIKTRINPATRIFQAIRIEVNDELTNLRQGLIEGFSVLSKGGRLLVISFHSLEDRIVKKQFLTYQAKGEALLLTKKPVIATRVEVADNPAARSAKLRVAEKK